MRFHRVNKTLLQDMNPPFLSIQHSYCVPSLTRHDAAGCQSHVVGTRVRQCESFYQRLHVRGIVCSCVNDWLLHAESAGLASLPQPTSLLHFFLPLPLSSLFIYPL